MAATARGISPRLILVSPLSRNHADPQVYLRTVSNTDGLSTIFSLESWLTTLSIHITRPPGYSGAK